MLKMIKQVDQFQIVVFINRAQEENSQMKVIREQKKRNRKNHIIHMYDANK